MNLTPAGWRAHWQAITRPFVLLIGLFCASAQAEVTLNLKDADISTLIQTVSEVTGRNFIIDPRVKGKVTVISSSPMDEDSVYETFLAVLQVQGFAAIPSGGTVKIVPETNARQEGSSFSGTASDLAIDEIVTHVYSIQNVSAAQLVPILRPLVPQWGHLAAYAPSNMLIIADRAANVQRMANLIRKIDQSGDRGIEIVRLEYATATDVVSTLSALAQGGGKPQKGAQQQQVAAIADERSNAVLIAGDRAERQKLLEVVAQLDIPVGEDGATQVVYLRFADAENLAPILEGYAEEANRSGKRAGAGKAASATRNQSQATVLADKDTNALIITAPPKTKRQIREVIAKLDIRRAQVLVEALIAEVSANKSAQLGVDWAVLNDERIAAAGILDPDTLSGLAAALAPNGSPAGLVSQGINIGAGRDRGDGTSFAVLIKALQGDGDSNILSTPTLVTLDNEEAEISVGQEVPFLTGSFSNTGVSSSTAGVVNPFQTIERKDVGLTLGITPQINEGNTIKLELELEISSLVSSATGAVDLITNKRTLNNTTSVDDGQVLVLGGLIDDSLDDTQRGVPFFSSIPVIGSLFQFRSINKVKRNLMIFIRPAILRKQAEGDIFSRRKYESLRSLQRSMGSTAVPLIGGERILLAPYDQFAERGSGTATEAEAEAGAQP